MKKKIRIIVTIEFWGKSSIGCNEQFHDDSHEELKACSNLRGKHKQENAPGEEEIAKADNNNRVLSGSLIAHTRR